MRTDSPVFDLFNAKEIHKHKDNLGSYLDYVSGRMLQLFRNGSASPFDVDRFGRTILFVRGI
jgi:hypothetical protein